MSNMRKLKSEIKLILEEKNFQSKLEYIKLMGIKAVGPLLSCLLLEENIKYRAAMALGLTVAYMAEQNKEEARVVLRRFMWHLNEESGNIGWGIPEAFAYTLAYSKIMAEEFHHILLSYIHDTGTNSNYCDNDLLRRSCYIAIAILAQARPDLAAKAIPNLIKGLNDQDKPCRGYATHALAKLPPQEAAIPALQALTQTEQNTICTIFNGQTIQEYTVATIAKTTLTSYATKLNNIKHTL